MPLWSLNSSFCSEQEGSIDGRLIDLAILIQTQLPRMYLEDVLEKVREQDTYKSYVVWSSCAPRKVLGGCIVREHLDSETPGSPYVELSLLAVDAERQVSGLGRLLVNKLKNLYNRIATFADLRAVGFFEKMGFVMVPKFSM